jgi:hypothetical protein
VPENTAPLPDFTRWPSFPFEGDMRVKRLAPPVDVEPPRSGEDASECVACNTPDDAYIWVSERWRVRAMDRPTGLPMVLILECRSHLDLGDLPNLLAAELGVMTVRLERAIRSLDGVARVHVNRWGDGSAHLHMWFLARPYGRLQLRGTFLSLWDDILPVIPEYQWRDNLALVAAWLAEFGGRANAEPPHIQWQSPSTISESPSALSILNFAGDDSTDLARPTDPPSNGGARRPADLGDVEGSKPDNNPGSSSGNAATTTAATTDGDIAEGTASGGTGEGVTEPGTVVGAPTTGPTSSSKWDAAAGDDAATQDLEDSSARAEETAKREAAGESVADRSDGASNTDVRSAAVPAPAPAGDDVIGAADSVGKNDTAGAQAGDDSAEATSGNMTTSR